MALFSYASLEKVSLQKSESYDYLTESRAMVTADSIDLESMRYDEFDIFLSHSYADKKIIPALKHELENHGFSVYVDWITDRLLSRESVNRETAKILQKRMNQSKCLLYATSKNSQNSRWMSWELGYFDGIKDKMVAIIPVKKDDSASDSFKGEEYLGLYYYIDQTSNLWINDSETEKCISFKNWLNGDKP